MNDGMEKIALALGGALLVVAGIMVIVPFGALAGAFAGWIVGWFFGETILGIAGQLGLHDVAMWQLGAFLGFVGAFLKTKVTAEVKAK